MEAGLIIPGFFSSPGDASDWRGRAITRAYEWNFLNTLHDWATVQPIIGKLAQAAAGDHPQEIINKLLKDCDFLIAVFRWELGTPTNKAASGTVHEIDRFRELHGGDRLCIYFSDEPLPMIEDRRARERALDEYNRLREYRRSVEPNCLYRPFDSPESFDEQLRIDLNTIVRDLVTSARQASPIPPPAPIILGEGITDTAVLGDLLSSFGVKRGTPVSPLKELLNKDAKMLVIRWRALSTNPLSWADISRDIGSLMQRLNQVWGHCSSHVNQLISTHFSYFVQSVSNIQGRLPTAMSSPDAMYQLASEFEKEVDTLRQMLDLAE